MRRELTGAAAAGLVFLLGPPSTPASAESLPLVPDASTATFSLTTPLGPLTGELDPGEGSVTVPPGAARPSAVRLVFDLSDASVGDGDPAADALLARLLEGLPATVIRFTGTDVRPTGTSSAVVAGTVTAGGRSEPRSVPVRFGPCDDRACTVAGELSADDPDAGGLFAGGVVRYRLRFAAARPAQADRRDERPPGDGRGEPGRPRTR